jgi:acetyl esterase/lipase
MWACSGTATTRFDNEIMKDIIAKKPFRLWPGAAPSLTPGTGSAPTDIPTLTLYPADKPNGAIFIVNPGGGYGAHAGHEGEPVATWFNSIGITALVLHYRLGMHHKHPAPMLDAQRAIRMARHLAAAGELQPGAKLDPERVGILGFSAGGHLAATATTIFDDGNPQAPDPIDRFSCRPDLSILIYPVISMNDPHTHGGSRKNLLPDPSDEKLRNLLSIERQVGPRTPPTFLVHSTDDMAVPVENSWLYLMAAKSHGVPVELHIYEHGGHGYGMGTNDPALGQWPVAAQHWLRRHGF